jgi:hypothetical protein
MASARETILLNFFGPAVAEEEYGAGCDRAAEREAAWYPELGAERASGPESN